MIGAQTQVTNENGNYRFPAVPPGRIRVDSSSRASTPSSGSGSKSRWFYCDVNAELAIASLQETLTVTGESPVIDTSATRVQQNFKLEQLNSIPNGRDMWALLAATPGVVMSRIDVGGNRAGTQTGYTATVSTARCAPRSRASTRRKAPAAPASTTTTGPLKKSSWASPGRAPKRPRRACSRTSSASRAATGLPASSTSTATTTRSRGRT